MIPLALAALGKKVIASKVVGALAQKAGQAVAPSDAAAGPAGPAPAYSPSNPNLGLTRPSMAQLVAPQQVAPMRAATDAAVAAAGAERAAATPGGTSALSSQWQTYLQKHGTLAKGINRVAGMVPEEPTP